MYAKAAEKGDSITSLKSLARVLVTEDFACYCEAKVLGGKDCAYLDSAQSCSLDRATERGYKYGELIYTLEVSG